MQYLRTNTATRITVGPFLDKTDGVTPEVALTVTSEKLTLIVDTGGVPTLILDVAPTASGGANDMVHITGDDAGYYDLELAAADVNYLGRAKLALTDAATHCPVFQEFTILPAQVYDSLILGSDLLDANATQWAGAATATDDVALATAPTNFAALAVTAGGAVTAGTVSDKTGYSIADATSDAVIADAVWNAAKATYGTAGTYGEHLEALVNSADPSAATIADAVWDEVLSGHLTAGTTGAALDAAGTAGDPWTTALPGAYGAGTAGKIVGDNLTGNAFTRLGVPAGASVSADVAAVKAETASLQTDTNDIQARLPAALESGRMASALDATGNNAVADAALKRDWTAVTGEASRSSLNALRILRNKWSVAAGTLTVTKEDDAATAYTAAVTSDAAAEPITAVDPT